MIRAPPQREFRREAKAHRLKEDSAPGQARTAQMGDQRPGGVHLQRAPARRDVLHGGPRRPRRPVGERGLHLPDDPRQERVALRAHVRCIEDLCAGRGAPGLGAPSNRGPPVGHTL